MSNQPSRSQQRQSRRAERRAEQERHARRQRLLLAGGAVALALILGLGLILLPRLTGDSSASTSNIQVAEGAPTGVPTSDRTMGDPNAPVTVVEWGDYQWPVCKQFTSSVKPQLVSQYVQAGKVKFEFRDFAFIGNESKLAAQAADCAANQNQFWAYHDTLYANQPPENSGQVTSGYLKNIAKQVGLDTGQFNQCLDKNSTASTVQQDLAQAQQQGLTGTPTIFVNGQKLPSASWDTVQAAVEAALKTKWAW